MAKMAVQKKRGGAPYVSTPFSISHLAGLYLISVGLATKRCYCSCVCHIGGRRNATDPAEWVISVNGQHSMPQNEKFTLGI